MCRFTVHSGRFCTYILDFFTLYLLLYSIYVLYEHVHNSTWYGTHDEDTRRRMRGLLWYSPPRGRVVTDGNRCSISVAAAVNVGADLSRVARDEWGRELASGRCLSMSQDFSRGFGVLHALASGTEFFLVLFSLRCVFNFCRCLFFMFARLGDNWLPDMDGGGIASWAPPLYHHVCWYVAGATSFTVSEYNIHVFVVPTLQRYCFLHYYTTHTYTCHTWPRGAGKFVVSFMHIVYLSLIHIWRCRRRG